MRKPTSPIARPDEPEPIFQPDVIELTKAVNEAVFNLRKRLGYLGDYDVVSSSRDNLKFLNGSGDVILVIPSTERWHVG